MEQTWKRWKDDSKTFSLIGHRPPNSLCIKSCGYLKFFKVKSDIET